MAEAPQFINVIQGSIMTYSIIGTGNVGMFQDLFRKEA
jgi:hypothetical protein